MYSCFGQLHHGSGLSVYLEGGKVIKHSNRIRFSTAPINSMLRLQYSMQVDSTVHWASAYNFPIISLELNIMRYGNNKILGTSYGFVPHISLPLFRFRKSSLQLSIGTGIAYNTAIYDYYNNPLNNAISTHWNNQTHFNLSYRHRFTPYESFQAGASLWHNSNGAGRSPNLGVNAVHLSMGYTAILNHNRAFTYQKKPYLWYEFPFQLEINSGTGFHQTKELRGPTYLVRSYELRAKARISKVFFLSGGLETDLNNAFVDFLLNTFETYRRSEAKRRVRRYAITIGGETLFGDVGLGVQAGLYVSGEIKQFPIYNKLYLRYYLLGKSKWIPRLHLGVVLKSHLATAEYIALRLGVTLKK